MPDRLRLRIIVTLKLGRFREKPIVRARDMPDAFLVATDLTPGKLGQLGHRAQVCRKGTQQAEPDDSEQLVNNLLPNTGQQHDPKWG